MYTTKNIITFVHHKKYLNRKLNRKLTFAIVTARFDELPILVVLNGVTNWLGSLHFPPSSWPVFLDFAGTHHSLLWKYLFKIKCIFELLKTWTESSLVWTLLQQPSPLSWSQRRRHQPGFPCWICWWGFPCSFCSAGPPSSQLVTPILVYSASTTTRLLLLILLVLWWAPIPPHIGYNPQKNHCKCKI